jgi:hypothetical protein
MFRIAVLMRPKIMHSEEKTYQKSEKTSRGTDGGATAVATAVAVGGGRWDGTDCPSPAYSLERVDKSWEIG